MRMDTLIAVGVTRMWNYWNPVEIRFGAGGFAELPAVLDGRSYGLVTYRDALFRNLASRLAAEAGDPLIIVDDVAPNPDVKLLSAQAARFRALPEEPALIVALGGGSVIDSAKVFAAARGDFGPVLRFLRTKEGGEAFAPLPLIAVPTTAGTGSEVTCWGTVWDAEREQKHSLSLAGLYPRTALVDPELTLGKSRELTISTGLDALSHALESLWNRNANPVSAALAVAAARGVLETLPRLADDLENGTLREAMARSALLAGLAFSNTKTAIAHSLSYPVTLRHGLAHGLACSFTLPMILRSVEGAGGVCGEGLDALFGSDRKAGAERLERMLEGLGVSTEPASYGMGPEEWRTLIDDAFEGERGQNFIGAREELLAAAMPDPAERGGAVSV